MRVLAPRLLFSVPQAPPPPPLPPLESESHLAEECAQNYGAENDVVVDARKDVLLAVYLPGVDFVEELHQDEGVEDDGVVLAGRRVEGGLPPAVNVEHSLTWRGQGRY